MSQIASDYQYYSTANQQIFTEELLYVHSKIVNFAKKHTLKKHAKLIRQEKMQQMEHEAQEEMDNSQFQQVEDGLFVDRQIQKRLQYLELSLDNKLNNFIFLISYGFMIYMIENLDMFGVEIENTYLPILKSPNNIKVIAELLERFITKSSIKINNKCFDDINQFLLERKEIKKDTKKKTNDQYDIPKRQNPIKPGTNQVLEDVGSENSSNMSKGESDESRLDNVNTFQETQAESFEEEQNLDAIIDRLQKSLHFESDFELSVSQIQSLVEQSSSLKTHYLQISLATLFQIHNIYTQNHSNSDLFVITQDKLYKAGLKADLNKFDPIYVIFQYLQFDPINVEDFQTEILERKVNLRLSNELTYFTYSLLRTNQFYKCIDCSAILPSHYLPSNQQVIIKTIKETQKETWKCSKGHQNSLKSYKCTEFSCDEFIEENAIKNFRLIKYYNVNKEYGVDYYQQKELKQVGLEEEDDGREIELTKKEILLLIYKVLQQCDPLKEGENEYVFFDKFKKKPKLKENPDLKNAVTTLLDELEKGFKPDESALATIAEKEEENQSVNYFDKMQGGNDGDIDNTQGSIDLEKEEKQKQIYWNDKFKFYKDMLGKVIDNRKKHNERQRLVKKALNHADAHLLENIAKLQDLVIKKQKTLNILRNSLIPEQVKQQMKLQQKKQQLDDQLNAKAQNKYLTNGPTSPNSTSSQVVRKPDSFAYYTTQKLFKKKVLISILFKSIQIVEIEKSIKFYIFCNNEGSFEILIVYAKEEFLDNFTSYNSHLYPNRMLLHKIYISVAQYREMKRLEYSKTQITFSTDTIQITFDMNKLVHMLSKKEGKIFDLI